MTGIPGTVPVAFSLSPARHGWIGLSVAAGGASDVVSCSHVFDPFQELADLFERALHAGVPGAVEIDEEGRSTFLRIDVEPGALVGRFRVYEPGGDGEVAHLSIDVPVDVVQLALAWHEAFSPYVAAYDPAHWTPDFDFEDQGREPPRTLAEIRLGGIRGSLEAFGALPSEGDPPDYAQASRARYAAALAG